MAVQFLEDRYSLTVSEVAFEEMESAFGMFTEAVAEDAGEGPGLEEALESRMLLPHCPTSNELAFSHCCFCN